MDVSEGQSSNGGLRSFSSDAEEPNKQVQQSEGSSGLTKGHPND